MSDLHCGYRILLEHVDFYSCGTGVSVLEACRLSSGSMRALLPCTACEILVPWRGIELTSPAFHKGSPLVVWLGRYLQFSLVAQSCPTFCDPVDCSTPSLPVHHQLPAFTRIHVHWVGGFMSIELVVVPSNHLILCCPLLLPPSIFPSIRVFSNELALPIRWLKYWSFSFNISPSNEYSGLIYFRMDWLDFLAVGALSRVFSNTTDQKHQFLTAQLSW